MDETYSQKQEILKKKGITPASKYHDYNYLYKSIITAMEQYHQHRLAEEKLTKCTNCGEMVKMISTGEFCPKCMC